MLGANCLKLVPNCLKLVLLWGQVTVSLFEHQMKFFTCIDSQVKKNAYF